MINQIQLVHESVLSVDHYLRNTNEGIVTVLLTDAQDDRSATDHLNAFTEKLTRIIPSYKPVLFAYCLREIKSTKHIYSDVIQRLNSTCDPSTILN